MLSSVNWIHNIPFFAISLSLVCSMVAVFVDNARVSYIIHLCLVFFVGCLSFVLLLHTVSMEEIFTFNMGSVGAPWGNELMAGPLEALMATVFSIIFFLVYFGNSDFIFNDIPKERQQYYFVMLNALFASTAAIIYTNDIFTAYIFIEINTIAACALVMLKGNGKSMVGTLHYMVVSLAGSGLFLLGFAILYSITGHLLFQDLQFAISELMQQGDYQFPFLVVSAVMIIGIAIRTALFPFHSWLTEFSPVGSPAFSSILTAVIVNSYIIFMIKLTVSVFTVDLMHSLEITNILFVFGLMGMFFGSLQATKERRMKRMLSYSSVAQIGYIYMGLGIGSVVGITAACFHIIAHAFGKTMLYLCCGRFMEVSGKKDDIFAMRGVALDNPIAGVGYTLGGLSMIGIPMMAGFSSKFYFASAATYDPFRTIIVLVGLGISMILNALYFLPSIMAIWRPRKSLGEEREIRSFRSDPSPRRFRYTMIILIFINLILGVWFNPMINAISLGIELLMGMSMVS
ncbi:MAG: proton-conducting transporter membrane subunit [Bacillota bacterium]